MKKFILSLTLLFAQLPIYALTADVTGTKITVQYEEPNSNVDDSPLVDLDKTLIYTQIQGEAVQLPLDVPATANTGGGTITQDITLPAVDGKEFNVDIWATAIDTSGNESEKSNTITVRVDRLAPKAPK